MLINFFFPTDADVSNLILSFPTSNGSLQLKTLQLKSFQLKSSRLIFSNLTIFPTTSKPDQSFGFRGPEKGTPDQFSVPY